MAHLNFTFVQQILPQARCTGKDIPQEAVFCIDSRNTITKHTIFVALPGQQVNGHDFVRFALENGAAGAIIAESHLHVIDYVSIEKRTEISIIIVPDVTAAFIQLAMAWRAQFTYEVIGITGSVGKTSTKELLATILQHADKNVLVSEGNQNTALGVSLNILRMRPEHAIAIFEMGISKRGEMARMAEIVRPTCAVITTIGHSHMEGLGSLVDIATEKRDIFKFFKENNVGVICGDQQLLTHVAYPYPMIKFGCKTINQVQARKIHAASDTISFTLKLYGTRHTIIMPSNNTGRVMNALAATAIAYQLAIPCEAIIAGIQESKAISGRYEHRTLKNTQGIVIHDAYNASPESMKAALLAFEKIECNGNKIAILGDMLELGVNAPFWHRQLGRLLRKAPSVHHVIFVGEQVKWAQKTAPLNLSFNIVKDWQEALTYVQLKLEQQGTQEATILIKGSRGIGLNNIVDQLTNAI